MDWNFATRKVSPTPHVWRLQDTRHPIPITRNFTKGFAKLRTREHAIACNLIRFYSFLSDLLASDQICISGRQSLMLTSWTPESAHIDATTLDDFV
jgi:hypothetical protein